MTLEADALPLGTMPRSGCSTCTEQAEVGSGYLFRHVADLCTAETVGTTVEGLSLNTKVAEKRWDETINQTTVASQAIGGIKRVSRKELTT